MGASSSTGDRKECPRLSEVVGRNFLRFLQLEKNQWLIDGHESTNAMTMNQRLLILDEIRDSLCKGKHCGDQSERTQWWIMLAGFVSRQYGIPPEILMVHDPALPCTRGMDIQTMRTSGMRRVVCGMGSLSYLSLGKRCCIVPGIPTTFGTFKNNIRKRLEELAEEEKHNEISAEDKDENETFKKNCALALRYTDLLSDGGYADAWFVQREYFLPDGTKLHPLGWKGAQLKSKFLQQGEEWTSILDKTHSNEFWDVVGGKMDPWTTVVDVGSNEAKLFSSTEEKRVKKRKGSSYVADEIPEGVGPGIGVHIRNWLQERFPEDIVDDKFVFLTGMFRQKTDPDSWKSVRPDWIRVISSDEEAENEFIGVVTAMRAAGVIGKNDFTFVHWNAQMVGTCAYGGGSTQGFLFSNVTKKWRLFTNNVGLKSKSTILPTIDFDESYLSKETTKIPPVLFTELTHVVLYLDINETISMGDAVKQIEPEKSIQLAASHVFPFHVNGKSQLLWPHQRQTYQSNSQKDLVDKAVLEVIKHFNEDNRKEFNNLKDTFMKESVRIVNMHPYHPLREMMCRGHLRG